MDCSGRIISNFIYYMKILTINCTPDFSYFTSKGLILEVDNISISKFFQAKKVRTMTNQDGTKFDLYTPDVADFLEQYKGYDAIMYGWSIDDYREEMKSTGGFTSPDILKNGAYWCTVRQDKPVNNAYAIHEMHHILCDILIFKYKLAGKVFDYMDWAKDDKGVMQPYYLNNEPNNPKSNHSQTWNQIKPYLSLLNTKRYKYFSQKEVERFKLVPELWELLDNIREQCGFPVVINSGLRTPEENAKLTKAVSDSAHLTGCAVDIKCDDSVKRLKIVYIALLHGIRRVGIDGNFVHLDIDKDKPECMWLYD